MIPKKKYWLAFPASPHEHDENSHPSMRYYSKGKWSPDSDVYEVEDGIMLIMDIAGINRDEIKITIENNILSISGIRCEPVIPGKKSIYRLEVDYGHFEKRFRIPDFIDTEHTEARYENGFLYLKLPKSKKRKIEISGA